MAISQGDILSGIKAELRDTPTYLDFLVAKTEREGDLWKVYVDLTKNNSKGLDESLEGADAWWLGPPKGKADVLSVIAENEQINLRFASAPPPSAGKLIRIYPPRYLEALYTCWNNDAWADKCIAWMERIEDSNSFDESQILKTTNFTWLRKRQAKAFSLPGWDASFLWGPPGTGKTTTLGAMLAQYLLDFPNNRVLLLSTTNSAVDIALIQADKALEQMDNHPAVQSTRRKVFRVGNHFIASNYKDREHLLPVVNNELIRQLAELEVQKPDPEDVKAYAQWKKREELIREGIRKQAARILDNARLAAMTTTRAVFTFDELQGRRPYDLIVFDEASQVGLAHALALSPLSKHCLFAGDPQQLAPIVVSNDQSAIDCLGTSMFSLMKKTSDSTGFLNEQSRMVEPICNIVSTVFYDGELSLAADCKKDPHWKTKRQVYSVEPIGSGRVHVENINTEGTWSHKYHGPIRFDSAKFICELVGRMIQNTDEKDVVVLTPFRAQRTLIRAMLRREGHRKISVSTVHRAQGTECHTVIFDPAMGNNDFLKTEDARRLVNVALSRAQARLLIVLSSGDRLNPLFEQIGNIMGNVYRYNDATPIDRLAAKRDFPNCALGRVVQIKNTIGEVNKVSNNGDSFTLVDFSTGRERRYITSYVVKNFG